MISFTQIMLAGIPLNDTDPVISKPIWIGTAQGFAVQASWADGDAVGTLTLEASCAPVRPNILNEDESPPVPEDSWIPIPDSDFDVDGDGTFIWNYDGAYFQWIRIAYAPTSGDGTTINATANIKSSEVL